MLAAEEEPERSSFNGYGTVDHGASFAERRIADRLARWKAREKRVAWLHRAMIAVALSGIGVIVFLIFGIY